MYTLKSIISGSLSLSLFLVMSLSSLGFAQDDPPDVEQQQPETAPIVEELHEEGYGEFANILEQSGIAAQLGDLEVTVFAPTDEALENLPAEVQGDERQLATIAMSHITEGETKAEELEETGHVQAVNGQPIEVNAEEDMISVANAPVVEPDIEVDGGLIHEMGDVIMPEQQQQQAPPQDDPPDPSDKD